MAAEKLKVEIVTPQRKVFSGEADEVRFPAWNGQSGILPGHDAFLSLLRAGVVTVVDGGKETRFIVGRGFAEAGPGIVTILCDSYESADAVDKTRATEELKKNLDELANASAHEGKWAVIEERVELAQARLDA